MSKKRKEQKNIRMITKSQKALYGVVFGILISVLVIVLFYIPDIFKLLYKPFGYLYVEPAFAAYVMLGVLISISFIIVICFYGSFIDKKKTLKQIKQKVRKILPVYLILVIVISVGCFSSVYCIDADSYSKKVLFTTQKLFTEDDINKINIRVVKSSHSIIGKGAIYTDYYIACSFNTENEEYNLCSDYFYSYRDMYNYLSNLNVTVEADRSNLEELCEHQRNIPINFSAEKVNENVEYINKIFDLENAQP
ncbi:MAG: hypothetical protein J1E05_07850 [Eubacterium sp.]|nr:hypothetical protein [Eubacterium sp.]